MKKITKNWYYLVIIILTGITFYILSQSGLKFADFLGILQEANLWFVLCGIICILLYMFIDAWILQLLMKDSKPDTPFKKGVTLAMNGQYYSLLTPSATGGQPVQVYKLSKWGFSVANGTAVVVARFMIYQISMTVIAVFAFFTQYKWIGANVQTGQIFTIAGLTINTIIVIIIFLLALRPGIVMKLLNGLVSLGGKLHIINETRQQRFKMRIREFIDDYLIAIKELSVDIKRSLIYFILGILQIIFYFSIPFFIYKALGLEGYSWLQMTSVQALVYMAIIFIPTPGTAGVAEVGFTMFYAPIFGDAYLSVGLVLWRIISYYFMLIFSGIYVLISEVIAKRKQKNLEKDNMETGGNIERS
jgi:hypothetical protein